MRHTKCRNPYRPDPSGVVAAERGITLARPEKDCALSVELRGAGRARQPQLA